MYSGLAIENAQLFLDFESERLFKPIGMKEIPNYEMKSSGFEDLFGKNVKGWVKDPNSNSTEGSAHLGIWAENMNATLEAADERGAEELPKGRNWIKLLDGLCIEFMQAEGNAVQDYWSFRPE